MGSTGSCSTVPVVGIKFRTRGHVHLGSRSEPQVAGMKHPKGGLEEYIVGYLCASELHTKLDIIKKLHVGKAGSEITLLAIRYDLPLPYSLCMTDFPLSLSHYANYAHYLVTMDDSKSLQSVITLLYYRTQ